MNKLPFTGAGVAIITPMHSDGSVNFDKLGEIIEMQINGGTDAIIICGTTGESATLNHEEHTRAIAYTVEKTAHRIPVIAGTGSNDTHYAVELCHEAEKAGADALLLVTPYYNKTTQAGLIRHYEYIADRVSLPMILYNVPSRTGLDIQPETYRALSAHPNIVATKEANGNIAAAARTLSLCGENLIMYSGNDSDTLSLLALGAKGVISVISNVLPRSVHDLCAKFFEGDINGARKLQLELMKINDALFIEVNPIPVKTAMNLMGLEVGDCRMPLAPMSDKNLAVLKKALAEYGLI